MCREAVACGGASICAPGAGVLSLSKVTQMATQVKPQRLE